MFIYVYKRYTSARRLAECKSDADNDADSGVASPII